MEATTERTIFTPAQIEILKAMSGLHTEEDLIDLKRVLVKFFADRIDKEMDRLWEEGIWNEQTLEDLKTAHYRTPYNPQR